MPATSAIRRFIPALLSRVLAVFMGCAIAFGISELALRHFGFEWTLYPSKVQFGWPTPQTFQWRYKPDAEFLWVRKDEQQMLGAIQQSHRPTIVFMGDSCTEMGVYVDKFRDKLNAIEPDRYTVVAVGTGGWSSWQGREFFEKKVLPLKPAIVAFYFGWNDHWTSFGVEDKNMARYYEAFPIVPAASELRTVQMLNFFLFRVRFKTADYPNRVEPNDFYNNLTSFIQLAKANGIQPVILTAPSSHVKGHEPAHLWERHMQHLEQLVPMHEHYVALARKAAQDNGATLVDLYPYFRQLPADTLQHQYFQNDGIHLQEAGDTLLAQKVLDTMVTAGLLSGNKNP